MPATISAICTEPLSTVTQRTPSIDRIALPASTSVGPSGRSGTKSRGGSSDRSACASPTMPFSMPRTSWRTATAYSDTVSARAARSASASDAARRADSPCRWPIGSHETTVRGTPRAISVCRGPGGQPSSSVPASTRHRNFQRPVGRPLARRTANRSSAPCSTRSTLLRSSSMTVRSSRRLTGVAASVKNRVNALVTVPVAIRLRSQPGPSREARRTARQVPSAHDAVRVRRPCPSTAPGSRRRRGWWTAGAR